MLGSKEGGDLTKKDNPPHPNLSTRKKRARTSPITTTPKTTRYGNWRSNGQIGVRKDWRHPREETGELPLAREGRGNLNSSDKAIRTGSVAWLTGRNRGGRARRGSEGRNYEGSNESTWYAKTSRAPHQKTIAIVLKVK